MQYVMKEDKNTTIKQGMVKGSLNTATRTACCAMMMLLRELCIGIFDGSKNEAIMGGHPLVRSLH